MAHSSTWRKIKHRKDGAVKRYKTKNMGVAKFPIKGHKNKTIVRVDPEWGYSLYPIWYTQPRRQK